MVMVSFAHDFIFLKTRKTAGTSIEMALEPFCRPPGATITERTPTLRSRYGIVGRRLTGKKASLLDWVLRRTDWYNHMSAARVKQALGSRRWARSRKITAIRNPFDLAVSRYHWELERNGMSEAADFDETRTRFHEMVRARPIDCDYGIVHIDGSLVPEHFIRFEHLESDVEALGARLGLDAQALHLPHTKKTAFRRRRPIADYYDAASTEAVRRSAAWIFDRFDYPLQPQ